MATNTTDTTSISQDATQSHTNNQEGWPGAFGVYSHSKDAVNVNLSTILALLLLPVAVVLIMDVLLGLGDTFISLVVQMVVALFVQAGLVLTYLASVKGTKVSVSEKLSESPQYVLNLFLLQLMVGATVFVGLLFFIIPGIILLVKLYLADYYLIDKKMSPIEAYKASFEATRGNTGKVWGIIGVNVLISLLIVTIIGIPFALYFFIMYSAATVLLYRHLNGVPVSQQA